MKYTAMQNRRTIHSLMKASYPNFPRGQSLFLIFVSFACLRTGALLAQQDAATQLSSGTAAINFQVLKTWRAKSGNHSVYFNRVAPPILPVPAVQVRPAPTPSPQYLAWVQAREQKAFKFVMLGGEVYDQQFADLRWFNGDQWLRIISNINFDYFEGMGEIETSDTIYDFFMMTSDISSGDLPSDSPTLTLLAQARQQLSSGTTGYIIVEGNAANNPDALAELDAIHTYYNANQTQLISDHQKRIEAWAKQSAWNKAHPPVPRDTVVNFWPVKSSLYLKGTNQ